MELPIILFVHSVTKCCDTFNIQLDNTFKNEFNGKDNIIKAPVINGNNCVSITKFPTSTILCEVAK